MLTFRLAAVLVPAEPIAHLKVSSRLGKSAARLSTGRSGSFPFVEEELAGGYTNSVVRIGMTVRRAVGPNSDFVHRLLVHFADLGVQEVPRYLGVDEDGREMLTYIEGYCPHDGEDRTPDDISDAALAEVFRLLRRLHDATAGSELAGSDEVVLYGDPAPRNTIFRDNYPVAFIDWDHAKPGSRIHDVAQAVWQWLEMGSPGNVDVQHVARRVSLSLRAYGFDDPQQVVAEILDMQRAVIVGLRQQMNGEIPLVHRYAEKALASVEREHEWLMFNRRDLQGALEVS